MHALGVSTICQNQVLPMSVTLQAKTGEGVNNDLRKTWGMNRKRYKWGRLARSTNTPNPPNKGILLPITAIAVKSHWLTRSQR
jgi:hypothetical protein